MAGGSCADGGTPLFDGVGNIIGCTLGGEAQSVTGGDCNNAGSVRVLLDDGSLNPDYNSSPLICPIGETFNSITQASGGFLGAEFSRVVGGIHTPDAVIDALTVWAMKLAPSLSPTICRNRLSPLFLAAGLAILAVLRHRRRSHRLVTEGV